MYHSANEPVTFNRDCPAVLIPAGEHVTLPQGTTGFMTQALGGSFTIYIEGNLFRIAGRDGDAIGQLLTRLGAHESLMAWEERRMRREVRATANRLANFDDANLRRSARAAVAAGARVERAMEILADEVPDHLRMAGELRLEHKQASLEELGQLHDPVLTKDAIAGRIRRLLAMADKRAEELGVPDTEASLTPDMLAEDA